MSKRHTPHLTIGLLLNNLTDARFADAWQGVADVARRHGANLRCFCMGSLENERWAASNRQRVLGQLINSHELDGLVTFQWWREKAWFEEICRPYQPLPIVNIMRHFEGYPGVRVDNSQAVYDQLQHAIDVHGCRKIAYMSGADSPSSRERFQAYQDVLQQYHIPFEPILVISGPQIPGSEYTHARISIHSLLDERNLQPGRDVDAITTFNDPMAFGVIDELHERGIQVPHDIAVIGFNNQEEADFSTVPLTTIAIPWRELGKQAASMLLEWLNTGNSPRHRLVSPTLVVRRSCGCLEPEIHHAGLTLRTCDSASHAGNSERARSAMLVAVTKLVNPIQPRLQSWTTQLVNAFWDEMTRTGDIPEESGSFLQFLEHGLRELSESGKIFDIGQDLLSTLMHELRRTASLSSDAWRQADILCQQGRIMAHKIAQRTLRRQQSESDRQAAIVREIGQRLITTFDVRALMDVLAEELPRLGLKNCFLSLYDDCAVPAGDARCILAYSEQGRISLPVEGLAFPAPQIVPQQILSPQKTPHLVIEALFFGERQIGFMVFGHGLRGGKLFQILRAEISSALQGALLVQEVRERDAALIREKYVIDTFFSNVPDRIYFKDCSGRLIRVNAAYAERIGDRDPHNVVGKTVFDFFPQAEAQRITEQEQEILRSGTPQINQEVHLLRWDDSREWVSMTRMPLRDEHGDVIGIFGISRDITALKQAEQELIQYREHLKELVDDRTKELRRSNEGLQRSFQELARVEQALRSNQQQYRMLAESVKDGIMIVQHQQIVFGNAVMATMAGLSTGRLFGSDPSFIFHFTDRRAESWLSGLTAPEPESLRQARIRRTDKQELWVEIESTPIVWNGEKALLLTIRNITDRKLKERHLEEERARLHQENTTLRSTIKERFRFGSLIGKSPAMQQVYELIMSAAASDVNVFIVGESGTGKELIARTVHQVSARRQYPFVAVNCASIPENLFEREFFGHRRGAFTGADRDKPGLFDRAHQGVLFLDEVTELTPGTQAKLLRVLQDGEYTPLGSNRSQQADVLIVAATNKAPQTEIGNGSLRRDFFYRICVIEIHVPPLRNRKEDLPLLIEHILEQYSQKQIRMHGSVPTGTPGDLTMLPGELFQAVSSYCWPGNVRELQNIMQRYLATKHLDSVLLMLSVSPEKQGIADIMYESSGPGLTEAVKTFEKRMIADTLARNNYHTTTSAEILNIPLRTLQYKMKLYGVKKPKRAGSQQAR